MGKKIVVLNGSPRKNGNTAALVDSFKKGAESRGHEVEVFYLEGLGIQGCKACNQGHSGEAHPCVLRDGMDTVYPAIKEADMIVLASPLYYWNMSGQLRNAVDRFYALEEDGNLLRGRGGKASALLMSAAGDAFEDMRTYYDHLLEYLQWENLGHVLAGGNLNLGDIQGKPEIEQAYRLGASIR